LTSQWRIENRRATNGKQRSNNEPSRGEHKRDRVVFKLIHCEMYLRSLLHVLFCIPSTSVPTRESASTLKNLDQTLTREDIIVPASSQAQADQIPRSILNQSTTVLHHVLPRRHLPLPMRALGEESVFQVREYSSEQMGQWLLGENHNRVGTGGQSMLSLSFWSNQPNSR
jgi:hypothetical protein